MLAFLFFLSVVYSVPVYVMLPLDTINTDGSINTKIPLDNWFKQLASSGVEGVMADVWWGAVEHTPRSYKWSGYAKLLALCQSHKLKFQATVSFHKCGGNVNDNCDIPLPQWILNIGQTNPNIYYADQHGNRHDEYLSAGVDNLALFQGRTPVQMYTDFVKSFVDNFSHFIHNTIINLQIGLGPAGELRYPSYPLKHWNYPGVGEFQCYDSYMRNDLNRSAYDAGRPDWGRTAPSNAGHYNCNSCHESINQCAPFFASGHDNFASPYGQFFLNWYSNYLIAHGERILSSIRNISRGIELSAKVSGIHWQYSTPSHSAELTAGYKNDRGDGYDRIIAMFQRNGVLIDFTCFEMRNHEQQHDACSRPEDLVAQTLNSAKSKIGYQGENALVALDNTKYDTIIYQSKRIYHIAGFTYLRLGDELMQHDNFNLFKSFVERMK